MDRRGGRGPRAPGRREPPARPRSQEVDLREERRGTGVLEAVMAGVVAIAVSVFLGGLVMGVIAVNRNSRPS